jgi:hypothetical protein
MINLLSSCSFYEKLPEKELTIKSKDLETIKIITEDISKNIEQIADSNGYYSDIFYLNSERAKRKLKVLKPENYKEVYNLYKNGSILSIQIRKENCISFLLKFSKGNPILYRYTDELFLVYNNKCEWVCGEVNNGREETIWTKRIDSNWSLIKNKVLQKL